MENTKMIRGDEVPKSYGCVVCLKQFSVIQVFFFFFGFLLLLVLATKSSYVRTTTASTVHIS